MIAVCSQIHKKHINTLCGQNVQLLNVKLAVHIVTTEVWRVKLCYDTETWRRFDSSHVITACKEACTYEAIFCRHWQ